MLHAANEAIAPQVMNQTEVWRWWMVNIYQTLSRTGVPLFVMLTGALLLQPSKNETLSVFFKKRWARIGLPFLFWGAIYFAWDYFANQQALTSSFIVQGILSGPYFQFWYPLHACRSLPFHSNLAHSGSSCRPPNFQVFFGSVAFGDAYRAHSWFIWSVSLG